MQPCFHIVHIIWPILSVGSLVRAASHYRSQQITSNAVGAPKINGIKIGGDITLGGLFPVHNTLTDLNPCGKISEGRGVQRVEAMLFAIDQINADRHILPGVHLGAHILDTCGSAAYALNQSLDFVRELMGEMDTSAYQCSDGSTPWLREKPQPTAGIVGGSYSGVSIQVANLLRLFEIVQVSPASTNADLSDKTKYEFFARTVPSDNFQAQAMVDIAMHFGWNYVTLVYSAGEYGELGAEAFKKAARAKKVCLAAEHKISKNEDLKDIIVQIHKRAIGKDPRTGARVVVMFTRNDDVKALLREAHEQEINAKLAPQRLIWLASEGWEMQPQTTRNIETTAEGSLVLTLDSQRVPKFEQYFLSLHPGSEKFDRNPWLRELWEYNFGCEFIPKGVNVTSNKTSCAKQRLSEVDFIPDNKIQFVIDAVYALAHALHQKWNDVCYEKNFEWDKWEKSFECDDWNAKYGKEFYQYLLNVTFKASGKKTDNKTFRFDRRGDGPAYYTILNYQRRRNQSDVSCEQQCDYEYIKVGQWAQGVLSLDDSRLQWNQNNVGNQTFTRTTHSNPTSVCSMPCEPGYIKQTAGAGDDTWCCWACAPCLNYQLIVNETNCEDCTNGSWPNAARNQCVPLPLQYMQWSTAYSIVPACISLIGIVLTCVVIVVYIKYSETPIVKASGRELSYILLGAMLMCHAMTFVLLAKPSASTCAIRRIAVGLGFSLLYGSMLVKTNRIHRIFNNTKNERPRFISPLSQVLITVLLAAIQLCGSLSWMYVQPPDVMNQTIMPARDTVVLKCNVPDHWFLVSLGYDAVLIVCCTFFAIQARRVPENFNEAKFIGFTMYTTCIIWLAFVPIYFGTGNDFQIQTTTLCISISLSAYVALFCIFSPKMWIILVEPEKNVRKQAGEKMLTAKTRNNTTRSERAPTREGSEYKALPATAGRNPLPAMHSLDHGTTIKNPGALSNTPIHTAATVTASAGPTAIIRKQPPPSMGQDEQVDDDASSPLLIQQLHASPKITRLVTDTSSSKSPSHQHDDGDDDDDDESSDSGTPQVEILEEHDVVCSDDWPEQIRFTTNMITL